MGVSKTSDHIQIKIKMPNPSQEPPVSSKALNEDLKDMPNPSQDPPGFSKVPNQDFKDMDVLGAFKIKIEDKNLKK